MFPAAFITVSLILLLEGLWRVEIIRPYLPKVEDGKRVKTLDGLRGFLALGVVFSHSLSLRQYLKYGKWDWPEKYHFFHWSAEIAVMLFFCITGYLFWGKAKRGNGSLKALDLYIRRFWRIYPLYLFLIVCTLLACLLPYNHEPITRLFKVVAMWAIPGLKPDIFVNGIPTGLFLTQTWTLLREFAFYGMLPIIAYFSKSTKLYSVLIVAVTAVVMIKTKSLYVPISLVSFFIGMGTAQLESDSLKKSLRGPIGTTMIGIGLVASLFVEIQSNWTSLCLLLVFSPIAYGNSFFGILALRPCRILGDVSYSIYMLHMLVLNFGLFLLLGRGPKLTSGQWWIFLFVDIMGLLIVSLASYQIFEKPFMDGTPKWLRHKNQLGSKMASSGVTGGVGNQ